jgi:hypothetical protein
MLSASRQRAIMPRYSLYFLRDDRGDIGHAYHFEEVGDAAAINFASVWQEDAPMELWCEGIRLKRWEAHRPASKGPVSQP